MTTPGDRGPDWLAALTDRVADLAAGRAEPVAARDAATVVLLRDGAAGLEVFLVRRARALAFAAGMHAFPGGAVEPGDGRWQGRLPDGWAAQLAGGDEELARRLVGAAVRETHEECGVWLAAGPAPPAPARADPPLDLTGVAVQTDLLRPWAHWVTPTVERRRFDTRFLVAALPPGQDPAHRGGEADEGRWLRPGDTAELPMLPPTAHTLAELAAFPDVAAVLTAPRTVTRVLPVVQAGEPGLRVLLPWEPDYPAASG